jgi:hypothetical protein
MVIDLQDPSIVNYYGWFFQGNALYIIMEYCDGGSLSDVMRVLHRPLAEPEVSAVMHGVLTSLVYVHSLRRIHRDIKAGNLLVTSDGQVKLCDFGVSAQLDDHLSRTGTRIGSPYWMAPEVISSAGHDTSADIWSLGITALELLLGRPPLFDFPVLAVMLKIPLQPPPEPPASASDSLKDFLRHALVLDPASRATAADLIKHPFVVSGRAAKGVVSQLVSLFVAARTALAEEEDGEEEEEEDAATQTDIEGLDAAMPTMAATLLFGDAGQSESGTMLVMPGGGTMIVDESGTMIVGGAAGSGLSDWKPEFIDTPAAPAVVAAAKRNFRNFSDGDLRRMLQSLKTLAVQELAKPQAAVAVIRRNYEDVRQGIVRELQGRGSGVPADFETLP